MKRAGLLIIMILCIMGLAMSGCSQFGYVVGTGPMVTKTFDFTEFTGVEISNSFEYDISQSANHNIMISTQENLVEYLDVFKSGTTLIVRLKNGRFTNPNPKVTITMPELNKLVVSGASKGSAKNFKSTDEFDLTVSGASQLNMGLEAGSAKIDVSGASKITGNLKTQETKLTISGASRCEISGSATHTGIDVSGASQANMQGMQMQDADVNLSGASTATINTSGNLNMEVSGASTLNYQGNPILGKVNVTGASKINAK